MDKRISNEVAGDSIGEEFKGYIFKVTGGNDKQGFPMKQGILTAQRVQLLFSKGHSCYRPRRAGERKRKSVRQQRLRKRSIGRREKKRLTRSLYFFRSVAAFSAPTCRLSRSSLSRRATTRLPASLMPPSLSALARSVPRRSASSLYV